MPISKYTNKLKLDFKVHIIDLIVVIIGVSVAFAITNWAERNKEQREIKIILNSMANEIRQDIAIFETHQIPVNQKNAEILERFLDIIYAEEPNEDSLIYYFDNGIFHTNNWRISRSTYLNMQEGAKLDIVQSYDLRLEIRNVYEARYGQAEYISKRSIASSEKMLEYAVEKVDLKDSTTYIEIARDRKFRNLVSRTHKLTLSKVNEYKINIKVLRELLDHIKEELGDQYIENSPEPESE